MNLLKISTWNVNSINARLEHAVRWLREASPDIVLVQEIKCEEKNFPFLALQEAGYDCQVYGQKSYNGVAILTKTPVHEVRLGLPGFDDPQARYIEAVTGDGLRIASVYVPNGQEVGSEKYTYKLQFYKALLAHLDTQKRWEEPFIIGGDFNVANQPLDVHSPEKMHGRILYSHPERAALRAVLAAGYADVFRALYPQTRAFSWWDYRAGKFDKDEGWRIDYLLASPQALTMIHDAGIDRNPRGWPRPSDHTPVYCMYDSTRTPPSSLSGPQEYAA